MLGYIMYIAKTLQIQELVHNMTRVINKYQGKETEIAILQEAAFQA